FEFERCRWRIELAFDRAPDFEPFLVRRERADARFESIGDNCRCVVMHQRRNLLLVGLHLVVSGAEPFVGVLWNLQFDDSERVSVDKDDDIWTAIVLIFNDCELIYSKPVVWA